MATNVIMPALEMAQETGKVLQWLKPDGATVAKGEPILEIETDKVTVEIEAPASGILAGVRARPGDTVPVGETIAWILAAGERVPEQIAPVQSGRTRSGHSTPEKSTLSPHPGGQAGAVLGTETAAAKAAPSVPITASPVALQIAREHGIDLSAVKPGGGRVEKADVLAYMQTRANLTPRPPSLKGKGEESPLPFQVEDPRSSQIPEARRSPKRSGGEERRGGAEGRTGAPIPQTPPQAPRVPAGRDLCGAKLAQGLGRIPASPKARRLAAERGVDLASLLGSGPGGAVLTADVLAPTLDPSAFKTPTDVTYPSQELSTVWRVMAERMTASWTTVPHFFLIREVAASALVEMRTRITPAVQKAAGIKPTYTDLLVKIIAVALSKHPGLNASWIEGAIRMYPDIHVGLATAIEDGLIVPVIHNAHALGIADIAGRRHDLVARANAGKLRPADISGGTFTLTNLGMYNVDAFNAIINAPQAAILAVGRIADRVVAVNGQPAVRPMMTLSLSCDHRVVDGARAARFLDDLAQLIEEPWGVIA